MVDETPRVPTWWTVKGVLIHRCALAAAGKWLNIEAASKIREGEDEPILVSEARWLASKLTDALSGDLDKEDPNPDRDLAWALVDAGGPYWTGIYDEFRSLSEPDQILVLEGDRELALETGRTPAVEDLTELSVCVARKLLHKAKQDDWRSMLSEIVNPFAFLDAACGIDEADIAKADRRKIYRETRQRIDLFVQRKLKPPLIVDLKTSRYEPEGADLSDTVDEVARKYGPPAVKAYGRDIQCQVLYLSFGGRAAWSDLVTSSPRKDSAAPS